MNAKAAMAACCHESPPAPASTSGSPSDKRPHERPATLRLLAEPRRRIKPAVPREASRIPRAFYGALVDAVRGRTPWPIFAFGPVGVGKTCGALWLCDWSAGPAIYSDFARFVDRWVDGKMGRLREAGSHGECVVTASMLESDWQRADLVVLDELGARERVTDAGYDGLRRLLDARFGQPLIVLANVDLDTVSRLFDDRVASRLAGGTVVRVDGPDRRLTGM